MTMQESFLVCCQLKESPLKGLAHSLPEEVTAQVLAAHCLSLRVSVSISLTTSVYENIRGAQDGLIVFDPPTLRLLDHLTSRILTEGKKAA